MKVYVKPTDPELGKLIEEIKCPLKALSVEGGEAFCNQPVRIGGLEIEKACLGKVPGEVKSTCAGCKLKMLSDKKKEKTILIPVIVGSAKCPAMNTEVDLEQTCLSCPYFNKEQFMALASDEGNSEKVLKVPCNYPNFPQEKIKLEGFIKAKKAAGVK